jgi:erythromycin esterase
MWRFGWRVGHVRELVYVLTHRPVELSVEQKGELHAWIKENAVHLKTVEAGTGFEDMQPLKDIIGDAQVVGLGEDPHLTREFYQVKHRIVEFLVTEMDFTVFAIEGTFAGALELNDYILTGEGDPERALAALIYPAWITEEVLAMVEWMREYNATHEKKVKFYGFDDKPARGSAKAVYDYLQKINGTKDYDELLLSIASPLTATQVIYNPKENSSIADKVESLIAYLENQKPTATQQNPTEQEIQDWKEWRLSVQYARVVQQNVKFLSEPISVASHLRDKHMAENARWIKDHEDDAKIILWAANPHICGGPGNMGGSLREMYGDDIVIIGLFYNRRFEKLNSENFNYPTGTSHRALAETLAEAGLNIAVLDLYPLPKGIVSKYFNSPINGGWVYPRAYDAILFIESVSFSHPTQAGEIRKEVQLDGPSNLDFEQVEDAKPKDWMVRGGQALAEYQTSSSNDQPYEGSYCGMIKRRGGRAFGQSIGRISQSIRPSELKGKTLQFSAAVRVTEGAALLWISVDNRLKEPDVFKKQIITSEEWREYKIPVEVSEKAGKISYGLSYVGHGAAFIDGISIEESN